MAEQKECVRLLQSTVGKLEVETTFQTGTQEGLTTLFFYK